MQNNFVLQTVVNGGKVVYSCKFHKNHWFSTVEIAHSRQFKTVMVNRMGLLMQFSSIFEAVDYFTTIAFSKDNLAHLYDELVDSKYGFCLEEFDFMTPEEFSNNTIAASIVTNRKLDEIISIYGLCVTNKDALEFIETAKIESS